ncbi:MAG: ATP-binding protein [Verrucomicrobiaceae bacterium]|nr:MAG: ATP-binding protein [Verrucomicrobiaceae bacterium]
MGCWPWTAGFSSGLPGSLSPHNIPPSKGSKSGSLNLTGPRLDFGTVSFSKVWRFMSGSAFSYRERISGPLLDRIDIHLEVGAVTYHEMAGKELGESSDSTRERVTQSRELQRQRFGKKSKVCCNARMSSNQIKAHCELDAAGEGMMQMAMTELNLSARAYDRILKVSRTIADLAVNNKNPAEGPVGRLSAGFVAGR